jgi:hypothetical protein
MKLDIVITWIDPHNKQWMKDKEYWYAKIKGEKMQYNSVANYSSFDEVKYCLRSIHKYMPWFNHIYLVTNNSSPKWLNKDYPQVTVIDHNSLMPNNESCYNSNAHESMLYKIPGLSEYFYYFNDDLMLLKPVEISNLINSHTGGLLYPKETDIIYSNFQYYTALQMIEEHVLRFDTGVSKARRETLKRMGIENTGIVSGHVPKMLSKTLCEKFNDIYSREIEDLIKTKFRTETNFTYIEAFIHYHQNKQMADWNEQSAKIITILDYSTINTLQLTITQLIIDNYDYLALEDARAVVNPVEEDKFITFLNDLFPDKAPWETQETQEIEN